MEVVEQHLRTARSGERPGGAHRHSDPSRGGVEHPEILAFVPEPAGSEDEIMRYPVRDGQRGAAVMDGARRGAQAIMAFHRSAEGGGGNDDGLGSVQSLRHQSGNALEFGRQISALHRFPPANHAAVKDRDHRPPEIDERGQGRRVELDDVDLSLCRQAGDRLGGANHRGMSPGPRVEPQSGVDQPKAGHRDGGLDLIARRGRTGQRQQCLMAEAGEAAGQIEAVLPVAAGRIGGDEDAQGGLHRRPCR
jgi:hypothetical protein